MVAKLIHSGILDGSIANRDQLIAFIEDNVGPVTRAGEDYISVLLPGTAKPKRFRGELFKAAGDYKQLVAEHHQSKIPKFLTPEESKDQQEKLIAGIRARTTFNRKRYLTPKPGAKRAARLPTTNLPHRVARRKQDQKEKPVPAKEIRSTWKEQLTQLERAVWSCYQTTDCQPASPRSTTPRWAG